MAASKPADRTRSCPLPRGGAHMPADADIGSLVLSLHENVETIPLLIDQLRPPALGVLPFVGAGLSMAPPFNLPGWGAFLRQQARLVDLREQIEQRLAAGEYEEAAQDLLDARGNFAFAGAIRAN